LASLFVASKWWFFQINRNYPSHVTKKLRCPKAGFSPKARQGFLPPLALMPKSVGAFCWHRVCFNESVGRAWSAPLRYVLAPIDIVLVGILFFNLPDHGIGRALVSDLLAPALALVVYE
jgi:hypothetical protein